MTTPSIALLAWGSLLWDGGDEFDRWHEGWQDDGPVVPLEFSRISSTRRGALTLVVDSQHGAPVQVAWCRSKRPTLAEAVADLCQREGTNERNIGRYAANGDQVFHDLAAFKAIRAWASDRMLSGVVWTDLRSNFDEKVGEPFSVDAALRYLSCLNDSAKAKAIEYLQRAPVFAQTPLRSKLFRDPR